MSRDTTFVSIEGLEIDAGAVTQTLYVDGSRTDTYQEDGSNVRPFKTIQAAINAASGTTWIIIFAGTYNEQILLKSNILLWAKREAVDIQFAGGDVITRPLGVGNVWLYGLQVRVNGGGTFAALRDVSNASYMHVVDCYFNAPDGGDFAIFAQNTQNIWMRNIDSDGIVVFDTVTGLSMDTCQVNNNSQPGTQAMHLLNCTNPIYRSSSILNTTAGGNGLVVDGGVGGSVSIANIQAPGIAVNVINGHTGITFGLCGFAGGANDFTSAGGTAYFWGANNYIQGVVIHGGTQTLVNIGLDVGLPTLAPPPWGGPGVPVNVTNAIDRIATFISGFHGPIP